MGYWKDPERTAGAFGRRRRERTLCVPEMAVWSGDLVVQDEDGFLLRRSQ
jgi:acyl-CoA synthetase (AMP-forming)/AMP-acid ligase II